MRLLSAILLLPGPAIFYIPALIFWLSLETRWAPSFPPSNLVFMVVGNFLAGIGIILAIITVRLFKLKGGDGTPAPWDPINNFVVILMLMYMLEGQLKKIHFTTYTALEIKLIIQYQLVIICIGVVISKHLKI